MFSIGVLSLNSCDGLPDFAEPSWAEFHVPIPEVNAKPEGSILSFLNGDVILEVLPGAVSQLTEMTVETSHNGRRTELITNMINVGPEVNFDNHVIVVLRCTGDLQSCPIPDNNCQLEVCCWDSADDFYNGCNPIRTCCELNRTEGSVTFCINKTGVFAIGIKE